MMFTTSFTTRGQARTAGATAALVVLLGLAACAGSGAEDSGADGANAVSDLSYEADAVAAPEAGAPDESAAGRTADGDAISESLDNGADTDLPIERAVISTGNVALQSDDVEQSAFDVQQVVDQFGGEITDQKIGTDDAGEIRHARMVIRVPSESFNDALTQLKDDVAELINASSTSEDVTTQVIDLEVRTRAQRRSLERIEVLLDQAQNLRDIVAIESELTRRQAELDSLEQQSAYLADQTSMSTITVSIERTPDEPAPKKKEKDDDGFVAGLSDGWGALKTFGGAVATLTGRVLPFAGLLAIIGVPAWLLTKQVRRRRPATVVPKTPVS